MLRIQTIKTMCALALFLAVALFTSPGARALGQRVTPRAAPGTSTSAPVDPFALRARVDATQESARETRETLSSTPPMEKSAHDAAYDRIVLKDGRALEGRVVSFSGRDGARLESNGEAQRVALVDVECVEATVGESFARGVDLFERARTTNSTTLYRGALSCFQEARRSSTRRFEREWATARVVDCLQALGRSEDAIVEFFLLCRLDSHSAHLASIPLRWQNQNASSSVAIGDAERSLEEVAAEWLGATDNPTKRANPCGRLLAASVLLNSSRYGRDAVEALRALATLESADASNRDEVETCREISLLATAQLWRQRLLATPTAEEIERWCRTTALLPNALQTGPTALTAQGERRLGDVENATRDFLLVATLALDARLARFSAESAAQLMTETGRTEEARRVLRRLDAK